MLGIHYKKEESISPNETRIVKTFSFRFDPWEMIKTPIREIRKVVIKIMDWFANKKLIGEIEKSDHS